MKRGGLRAALLAPALLLALALQGCGDDYGAPTAACMPVDAGAHAGASVAALRPLLAQARAEHGLNAVLLGVTAGGEPILTTALGEARPGVAATTAMHFRVGMPAEQLAVMLMLQLADQGRLDLDAPVSRWFPGYPHAERATVRMLAASSAGFGDYVYGPANPALGVPSFDTVLYGDPHRQFTTAELIDRSRAPYQVPQFDNPGGDWRYSHTSFAMLGAILESVTGRDYGALLRERILSPLGLHNTEYAQGPSIQAPVLHAYTSERGRYEDSTGWSPSWTSYSGRINSDLCDLTAWARAFGRGELLSPESAARIAEPANVGLGPNIASRYFGLGVIVHNGWLIGDANFFGWHTATAYHPGKDIAIALTLTEGPATQDANGIARALLGRLSAVLTPANPIALP
ncbi:serine hydrolase [Cupriavidus sp. AU9028]|uniref:serine hydrolase domain-containing protein n=1 Tax=Cupriavidus sp. AU9028 TaxID=2871157 RepID=UPI001C969F98|nr:serine hydrolase domain-containing protein [Cupriavidus sp. AU9028]MBY4897208.1 beta-lactamase family protein [Cupriavidus sp. AU9028]